MAEETPKVENKVSDLEPNVAATLSYLIPIVTGILFLIMEKKNKFVRFHAMQSIIFWSASWILWLVANSLILLLVGLVLRPIIGIATFCLWLYLMWKAYNNIQYEIPYLGKFAKDLLKDKK